MFDRDQAEIWRVIQDLNQAWTHDGDWERLRKYFHPRMVAITPSDRFRREGGEACLAGWKSFMDSFEMTHWQETDPQINLFLDGRVAIVTYYFETTVKANHQELKLSGRDMFTLIKEGEDWKVVADQFSPFPGN